MFADELIGRLQEAGEHRDVYLLIEGETRQIVTDFEIVVDDEGFIALKFEDN